MKILHVLQNYYPSIGGTQILFQKISENLVANFNDEVEVFTTDSYFGPDRKNFKKIPIQNETLNGVSIHRFAYKKKHKPLLSLIAKVFAVIMGKVPQIIKYYSAGPWSFSLVNALKKTEADVIVASCSSYMYMHYPLWRNKFKNPKPFVFQGAIHFKEDEEHKVILDKTIQAIKASEFYLANTDYEKYRLIKLGISQDSIVVVGTGVDIAQFENGDSSFYRKKFNIPSEEIIIAYIGRLEPTKSIHILINAFKICRINNKKIHLVIAGFESIYVSELKKLINEKLMDDISNVHLLLNLSSEEKSNLYQCIDILVLPSENESFGIVFLEAWACKKPVIGCNIGAIKSVITEGVDGLLAKPNNAESFSEKIMQLVNNNVLRIRLGNAGYEKTKQHYSWDVVTKKYRDVYVKAIQKFNEKQN